MLDSAHHSARSLFNPSAKFHAACTLFAFTSALNGLQVGPGSYTQAGRRVEHGYAPFSSTAERDLQAGPVTGFAYTPGPGYYAHGSASAQAAASALHLSSDTNAPFHSTGSKFASDKRSCAAAPGPGSYSPQAAWVKNTFRWDARSRRQCLHVHMLMDIEPALRQCCKRASRLHALTPLSQHWPLA